MFNGIQKKNSLFNAIKFPIKPSHRRKKKTKWRPHYLSTLCLWLVVSLFISFEKSSVCCCCCCCCCCCSVGRVVWPFALLIFVPLSLCVRVCVCVCNFRFVFVCCWYIFCLFRLRCNGRRQRRPTMMKSGVWAGRSGSWRSYFSVVHDGFTSVMNDDDRDRPSRRWLSLSLSLTQTHSHRRGRRKRLAARGSRRPIRASRRQRWTKKERNGTHQRGSHRCCCCCCCCCCCSRLSFQNSRRETLRCGVCVLFLGFLGFHFDVASLFVETFLKRWSDYFSSHFSWI